MWLSKIIFTVLLHNQWKKERHLLWCEMALYTKDFIPSLLIYFERFCGFIGGSRSLVQVLREFTFSGVILPSSLLSARDDQPLAHVLTTMMLCLMTGAEWAEQGIFLWNCDPQISLPSMNLLSCCLVMPPQIWCGILVLDIWRYFISVVEWILCYTSLEECTKSWCHILLCLLAKVKCSRHCGIFSSVYAII